MTSTPTPSFDAVNDQSNSFDELIHSPVRLRICAALATAAQLEFVVLEEALGVSTSSLSKQLRLLTDAGYVKLEKQKQSFGRPRTWVGLTLLGRKAFNDHVAALRLLIDPAPKDASQ